MKLQVIMLPVITQEFQVDVDGLFINDSRQFSWGKLEVLKCERLTVNGHAWNGSGVRTYINHLYFFNNEKIIQGDWCIELVTNKIFKVKEFNDVSGICRCEDGFPFVLDACRKIIATTDKGLFKIKKTIFDDVAFDEGSPINPTDEFILYYINEYLKGNVINEVEADYKFIGSCSGECGICDGTCHSETILKIEFPETKYEQEKIYTRTEVIQLLKGYRNSIVEVNPIDIVFLEKWVERNL